MAQPNIQSLTLRGNLRQVTAASGTVPVYTGGGAAATAFYINQVIKGTDKPTIVRAIGCAVMAIFGDQGNIFRAATPPEVLTGLNTLVDPAVAGDTYVTTNFYREEPVTKNEILQLAAAENEELSAVVAMYCWTAGKTPTQRNLSAYDARRLTAVSARCLNSPVIFGQSSSALSLRTLTKASSSLTAEGGLRTPLFEEISNRTVIAGNMKGGSLAFMAFFGMLRDVGLGAIKVIDQGYERYPWAIIEFPELIPEIDRAMQAKSQILSFSEPQRSFCKVIHGDLFTPVAPRSIANAFGVYKQLLSMEFTTYTNYGGGTVTPKQMAVIQAKMGQAVAAPGFQPVAAPSTTVAPQPATV